MEDSLFLEELLSPSITTLSQINSLLNKFIPNNNNNEELKPRLEGLERLLVEEQKKSREGTTLLLGRSLPWFLSLHNKLNTLKPTNLNNSNNTSVCETVAFDSLVEEYKGVVSGVSGCQGIRKYVNAQLKGHIGHSLLSIYQQQLTLEDELLAISSCSEGGSVLFTFQEFETQKSKIEEHVAFLSTTNNNGDEDYNRLSLFCNELLKRHHSLFDRLVEESVHLLIKFYNDDGVTVNVVKGVAVGLHHHNNNNKSNFEKFRNGILETKINPLFADFNSDLQIQNPKIFFENLKMKLIQNFKNFEQFKQNPESFDYIDNEFYNCDIILNPDFNILNLIWPSIANSILSRKKELFDVKNFDSFSEFFKNYSNFLKFLETTFSIRKVYFKLNEKVSLSDWMNFKLGNLIPFEKQFPLNLMINLKKLWSVKKIELFFENENLEENEILESFLKVLKSYFRNGNEEESTKNEELAINEVFFGNGANFFAENFIFGIKLCKYFENLIIEEKMKKKMFPEILTKKENFVTNQSFKKFMTFIIQWKIFTFNVKKFLKFLCEKYGIWRDEQFNSHFLVTGKGGRVTDSELAENLEGKGLNEFQNFDELIEKLFKNDMFLMETLETEVIDKLLIDEYCVKTFTQYYLMNDMRNFKLFSFFTQSGLETPNASNTSNEIFTLNFMNDWIGMIDQIEKKVCENCNNENEELLLMSKSINKRLLWKCFGLFNSQCENLIETTYKTEQSLMKLRVHESQTTTAGGGVEGPLTKSQQLRGQHQYSSQQILKILKKYE